MLSLTSASPASALLRMDEPQRQRALKRLGHTAMVYAVAAGFVAWICSLGLLPLWAALLQVGYWGAGLLVFFMLLRSGRVYMAGDPMLVFAQVLFGISAVALCYAVNARWQGLTLQMLFVLLVFDMQRLGRLQIMLAAWVAVVTLLTALLVSYQLGSGQDELMRGLFYVALATVHMPLLAFLAREVRGIRLRQEESRQALHQALARLSELSSRDALTGAYNRRHGMECVQREVSRQARGDPACALALIDLDHFKQINDHHGHQAGDEVLKACALIARRVCKDDVFIRWGGEEFLLLMVQTDLATAQHRLEQLRLAMQAYPWAELVPGRGVTFSAGLAAPWLHEPAETAIERADRSLYRAKQLGRDRVCVAEVSHG